MLSELAFSGRHAEQSVWVISQRYNSVLKDLREQTKWLCMFYTKDRDSFDNCLRENDVIPTLEERQRIKEELKKRNIGIACRSNKMASALAMMLGGAITNAFAFSGSNYLFSHMGSNANEEKIRHDKAIEKLEKAQAEWNKKRIQRLDFLNEQLQKEHHAEHTFEDVDQAMKQYYYITSKQLTPLSPKPKLSDFYTPSEDQKNREIAFVVGGMVLTGFIVWKLK
ncbi:unnamed protein product [Mytilus coruscus]|uniref:Uncharacterized protein n=1 Tax=Mytilus coruscus TaxID=42192 RepID=A0A6J8BZM6_MYTCO|nr:unnamed protein product [Mytilus coruscus]